MFLIELVCVNTNDTLMWMRQQSTLCKRLMQGVKATKLVLASKRWTQRVIIIQSLLVPPRSRSHPRSCRAPMTLAQKWPELITFVFQSTYFFQLWHLFSTHFVHLPLSFSLLLLHSWKVLPPRGARQSLVVVLLFMVLVLFTTYTSLQWKSLFHSVPQKPSLACRKAKEKYSLVPANNKR